MASVCLSLSEGQDTLSGKNDLSNPVVEPFRHHGHHHRWGHPKLGHRPAPWRHGRKGLKGMFQRMKNFVWGKGKGKVRMHHHHHHIGSRANHQEESHVARHGASAWKHGEGKGKGKARFGVFNHSHVTISRNVTSAVHVVLPKPPAAAPPAHHPGKFGPAPFRTTGQKHSHLKRGKGKKGKKRATKTKASSSSQMEELAEGDAPLKTPWYKKGLPDAVYDSAEGGGKDDDPHGDQHETHSRRFHAVAVLLHLLIACTVVFLVYRCCLRCGLRREQAPASGVEEAAAPSVVIQVMRPMVVPTAPPAEPPVIVHEGVPVSSSHAQL